MADFVQKKQPNFRSHGNKGLSRENVNSTIKSAVPENPMFGDGNGFGGGRWVGRGRWVGEGEG